MPVSHALERRVPFRNAWRRTTCAHLHTAKGCDARKIEKFFELLAEQGTIQNLSNVDNINSMILVVR